MISTPLTKPSEVLLGKSLKLHLLQGLCVQGLDIWGKQSQECAQLTFPWINKSKERVTVWGMLSVQHVKRHLAGFTCPNCLLDAGNGIHWHSRPARNPFSSVTHCKVGPQLLADMWSKLVIVMECIIDTEINLMWRSPTPTPHHTHNFTVELHLTLKPLSLFISVMVTIWL